MAAPLVAVGDGALGFWAAVRDVWPETQSARCWCHKIANVLDKLPQRLQAQAKSRLHEVMYTDTKEHATEAVVRFAEEYEAKYPKAVACLRDDQERLLVHFDFPAEHWKHLRTTNIIESPFSTVRLRTRVTKGAGSRTKALLMAYKLLDMAQERWRKLDGAELLAQARAGVSSSTGFVCESCTGPPTSTMRRAPGRDTGRPTRSALDLGHLTGERLDLPRSGGLRGPSPRQRVHRSMGTDLIVQIPRSYD